MATGTPVPVGTITQQGKQWLRMASLVVAKKATDVLQTTTPGLDLSALHYRFTVRSSDLESPNTLTVRVYNLSDSTQKTIIDEFDQITLQVGYKGTSSAILFTGQIKNFKKGKEKNTDTFLEINAADSDSPYNFAFVNTALGPGSTNLDLLNQCANAMQLKVDKQTTTLVQNGNPQSIGPASTGGVFPRGRVLFGLARLELRTLAQSLNCRWSIQNGVLTLIPLTSYLDGQAVILNSQTGLIGQPEATDDGVEVRCLIQPLIRIGQRIQIDNSLINTTIIKSQFFPTYTAFNFPANVTADGIYRVLAADHIGDTRGNDWYSDLICLAVDPSSPPADSVPAYP